MPAPRPHAVEGLLQVNFRVPAKAPLGDAVPVTLTVGNSRSPDGVTMAVRSATQRILVIDDALTNRNWLSRVLSRAGYEVFTARSNREAAEHADERAIDLVISNLSSGSQQERLETIRRVEGRRPQLKVVATAAALGPEALRAAELRGAQSIFTRPMSARAVVERVRDLLRPRPVPYEALEILR